jgi:hypothetical protein
MFDSMKSSSLQIMPLLTNLDSPHSTSHNSKAKMQSPTANEAFFIKNCSCFYILNYFLHPQMFVVFDFYTNFNYLSYLKKLKL